MFFRKKAKIITDEKTIDGVLNRGVVDVLPSREGLKKLLMSGKRITLYQGFDPTGTELHIGHMVGLRKLRDFQKLGHRVIFLMGDGTGQAGDPSGKTKSRDTFFTKEQLRKNAKTYKKQAGTILDFKEKNPVEVLWNSTWLNKLRLIDILNIANHFTLQQLSERDMFQERLKNGEPVNLREFLYPLLQGYDSVAMGVDLEIGGNDQLFNMMTGRTLEKNMLGKEKFVLTTPLLADSSGKKIGKTEGNVIALLNKPETLYGQIMSLGDEVVPKGLEYLTDISMEMVEKSKTGNPLEFKRRLAFEIVKQLHGEDGAKSAQEHFINTFSKKQIPDDMETVSVEKGTSLIDVLFENVLPTKGEVRRLMKQGGLTDLEENKKITDEAYTIEKNMTLKVGKKWFLKIEVSE